MNTLINEISIKQWILNKSKKNNWFVQYSLILSNRQEIFTKYLDYEGEIKNCLIINGQEYLEKEELAKNAEILSKKFKKVSILLPDLNAKLEKILSNLKNYTRWLNEVDFEYFATKGVVDELIHFQNVYCQSLLPGWLQIETFLEANYEDYFFPAVKTMNTKELFIFNEPIKILEIADQVKHKNIDTKNIPPDVKQKIESYIDKYGWLKGPTETEFLQFTDDDIFARIKLLVRKDLNFEKSRVKQLNLLKSIKPGVALDKKIFESIREFIVLRLLIEQQSDILFFTARNTILNECANRLQLFRNEIVQLSSDEIIVALQRGEVFYQSQIEKRNEGLATVWIDSEVQSLFGEDAGQLEKIFIEETVNQINGKGVFPGKFRGHVKIISNLDEASQVDGDILVTTSTNPGLISAIENASAVVTDVGGLTSHAAIITPIFGIPCVIGTGNGSKVLKDGILAEIDGDKGTITIIN